MPQPVYTVVQQLLLLSAVIIILFTVSVCLAQLWHLFCGFFPMPDEYTDPPQPSWLVRRYVVWNLRRQVRRSARAQESQPVEMPNMPLHD